MNDSHENAAVTLLGTHLSQVDATLEKLKLQKQETSVLYNNELKRLTEEYEGLEKQRHQLFTQLQAVDANITNVNQQITTLKASNLVKEHEKELDKQIDALQAQKSSLCAAINLLQASNPSNGLSSTTPTVTTTSTTTTSPPLTPKPSGYQSNSNLRQQNQGEDVVSESRQKRTLRPSRKSQFSSLLNEVAEFSSKKKNYAGKDDSEDDSDDDEDEEEEEEEEESEDERESKNKKRRKSRGRFTSLRKSNIFLLEIDSVDVYEEVEMLSREGCEITELEEARHRYEIKVTNRLVLDKIFQFIDAWKEIHRDTVQWDIFPLRSSDQMKSYFQNGVTLELQEKSSGGGTRGVCRFCGYIISGLTAFPWGRENCKEHRFHVICGAMYKALWSVQSCTGRQILGGPCRRVKTLAE